MLVLFTYRRGKHSLDIERIEWHFNNVETLCIFSVQGALVSTHIIPSDWRETQVKIDDFEARVLGGTDKGRSFFLRPLRDATTRFEDIKTLPILGNLRRHVAWSKMWGVK